MYQKFSKATENKNLVSADLSEKRILLSSLETQTAEIVAEDKQLNHNFKREFIEAEPFYNKLLHMYRFRAANQVRASALVVCEERRVYAQSMETECGEQYPGVEQAMHHTERGVDCTLLLEAPVYGLVVQANLKVRQLAICPKQPRPTPLYHHQQHRY